MCTGIVINDLSVGDVNSNNGNVTDIEDCDSNSGKTQTLIPKPDRFYMVSFNTFGSSSGIDSGKAMKYFVGQLLKNGTNASLNEFNFKFMCYSRKVANQFVWPNADDEAVVSLEDVRIELSAPKCARRGGLIFLGSELGPYMKWIN